jgi:hydrogenase maturation factor
MSDQAAVDPLWAFALTAVLPDLAEQDLEAFCSTVLKDHRIRDRIRRELLFKPLHKVNDLSETDQVELCQISRDVRLDDVGREQIGRVYHLKLVHFGAIPFRIREALRQLFRERLSGTYRSRCGKISSDGRYELRVEVDEDTETSDAFEVLEDAYMRALDKRVCEECIPTESDGEDVDITDKFCVQPDTALYDAYDLTIFFQEEQIREAFLEDCLAFFADTGGFQLPETVKPLTVPSNQVWVRKPRLRIVLAGCRCV